MKRQVLRRITYMVLALLLLPVLAGCSGKGSAESAPEVEEPLYAVSLNGTEIRVGETRMQALLDAGFDVTWSEMIQGERLQIQKHTVDPQMELEANTYYTGASITISDHISAHVSFVTEETVTLGDAVIARMEFNFTQGEDNSVRENIVFNGVPVSELTREKAGEVFPDFKGDSAMWFSSGLRNYDYFLGFNSNTGEIIKFSVEREYDVDWSGN